MNELPPEDQPDVVWVGPVGPIPIQYEDDPRFETERAAWSHARKKAQAIHSAEELLEGVVDDDWRVRFESIDRLAARWHDDPRTLPALLDVAEHDSVWQVRSSATMRLVDFDPDAVVAVARRGAERSERRRSMVSELHSLPVRPVEVAVRDAGRALDRSRRMSCNMFRANGHQIAARYYVWDLEGGPMGWKSPEYNAFHPVDPYLFELGWRAWLCLVEELNDSSALTAIEFAGGLARPDEKRCRFVTEATAWPLLDRRVA